MNCLEYLVINIFNKQNFKPFNQVYEQFPLEDFREMYEFSKQ